MSIFLYLVSCYSNNGSMSSFVSTSIPLEKLAKLRSIEMTRDKEKRAGVPNIGQEAGPTPVPSDLLCGRPHQLSPLKKPMARTATMDPCRFHQLLPHTGIGIDRHQSPESLSISSPTCRILGSALATSQGLRGYMSAKHQPRPPQLTLTAVHALRADPSSCATACCQPDIHHQAPCTIHHHCTCLIRNDGMISSSLNKGMLNSNMKIYNTLLKVSIYSKTVMWLCANHLTQA